MNTASSAQLSYLEHLRALIKLAIPLAASQLAYFSLHATDTIMLGWYNVTTLAASVLGAASFYLIFVLGAGFAKAITPIVAAHYAKQDMRQAMRVGRMGLWISFIFGLSTYGFFWWSGSVFLALGQNPDVASEAQDYLRVVGLGIIPSLFVMVLGNYLAAFEKPQVVLWITIGAIPLNFLLNWILIFGNFGAPNLGIIGSAIATIIVQIVSLAALALYIAKLPLFAGYNPFVRIWRPDWESLGRVFRLGWPIGMTGLAEVGLFQSSTIIMGWVGLIALASHGIAVEITAMTFMIHQGLSSAITIRIGHFYGNGDITSIRRCAFVSMGVSLVVIVSIIFCFLTFPHELVGIFLDKNNPQTPQIIATGTILLACAALFQVADAAQALALGLLAGVQDTKKPMVLASISYWLIGMPSSYIFAFPLGFGAAGVWFGLVIGLSCAAISLTWHFWSRLSTRLMEI